MTRERVGRAKAEMSTADAPRPDLTLWTIQEVSRQTGVDAATLRAWERRYAVPAPRRTLGGFRVYGPRDIGEIRSIVRRCAKGLRPHQAAFIVLRERVTAGGSSEPDDVPAMRRRLEEACLTFDDAAAAAVLEQASIGCKGTALLREFVIPVVATIAAGHHAGAITVSQEHFASQLARRISAKLLAATAPASTKGAVLLGCAPGEQHELGLLWLACELRQRGFRVIYLGPAVPVDSFLAACETLDAPIGIVGATMPSHLKEWSSHLRRLSRRRRPTIVWAGPASPMAKKWPGCVAHDVEAAIEHVVRLSLQRAPAARRVVRE